jgi:hypothetical protein
MKKVLWVRILFITTAVGAGLLALGVVVPLAPGLEGATLCYPVFGPFTKLAPDLPPPKRASVAAHEAAHAAQCRRYGAVGSYFRQVQPTRRLSLEIEAYCSEATVELAEGKEYRLVRERILDELEFGYPLQRHPAREELMKLLAANCPALDR